MRSNLDRSLTSPLAQVAEDGIGSTSSTMTRAGENNNGFIPMHDFSIL